MKIEMRYNPPTTHVQVWVFDDREDGRYLLQWRKSIELYQWVEVVPGMTPVATFDLSSAEAANTINNALASGIETTQAKPMQRDASEIEYMRTVVDRLLPE